MKFGKWLGGGLGWAFGGPLGGLLGFIIGSAFDNAGKSFQAGRPGSTRPGDFALSLLVLSAAVMKADGKVLKSELDFVRKTLVKSYGEDAASEMLVALRDILKRDIPLRDVCEQIRLHMPMPAKLQLIHFLYGIAMADGDVHESEVSVVEDIGNQLGVNHADLESLKAMYFKDIASDYKVLEVDPNCSDDELKKSYRKLVVKYHPDKLEGLGPEVQKAGKEKFQMLGEAYDRIRKKRGLK